MAPDQERQQLADAIALVVQKLREEVVMRQLMALTPKGSLDERPRQCALNTASANLTGAIHELADTIITTSRAEITAGIEYD